ncbi:MAG: Glucose--fructose oxidoreductase [Anaerolineae bacterium]|nr:Glucose--fructose oxidoreductase [Anaerolineae bacterium]
MSKVRWGQISTANIGVKKVLPAMQRGKYSEVVAIASRELTRARQAAHALGIPKAYGSYQELLADPDIDAVYNPLPNHLHVPWSIRALEAGKHVLCEKPLALTAAEAQSLLDVAKRYPKLKVMEAFMYRHHPQWVRAKKLVGEGKIGTLRTIHSFFSYYNDDPANVRNMAEIGGGGLMDIGCYNISLARFIFDKEPQRVVGIVEYDPQFKTDRLASGMMDFGDGTATWTCSTQLAPYQRVNIFGTRGRIEIEIPFNAPPNKPCKMWYETKGKLEEIVLPTTDQYTVQGDLMSLAILKDLPVPTPLEDGVNNMRVIEALVASGRAGTWVTL